MQDAAVSFFRPTALPHISLDVIFAAANPEGFFVLTGYLLGRNLVLAHDETAVLYEILGWEHIVTVGAEIKSIHVP